MGGVDKAVVLVSEILQSQQLTVVINPSSTWFIYTDHAYMLLYE